MDQDEVKLLLLELLAPTKDMPVDSLMNLVAKAQDFLLQSLQEHRLGPMLRFMLRQYHPQIIVPDSINEMLENEVKQAAFRSLRLQQSLIKIHRALSQHQIPYIALKGAYLAFHAYPQPALRPMRDLDILVPEDRDLEVYERLQAEGFPRNANYQGNPTVVTEFSHHLPPLIDIQTKVSVEVHNKLSHSQYADFNLASDQSFWSRSIQKNISNELINFESPTDLLLHLIYHAAYQHCFDNGPLLLTDIAFLIQGHQIDWLLFWGVAQRENIMSGCVLVLKMTERYWPKTSIIWPRFPVAFPSDNLLNDAAISLLRDYKYRGEVALKDQLSNSSGTYQKLALLFRKVFPKKQHIYSIYPVRVGSIKVYFYYFFNLCRLVSIRLPRIVRSMSIDHSDEIRRLTRIQAWLSNEV